MLQLKKNSTVTTISFTSDAVSILEERNTQNNQLYLEVKKASQKVTTIWYCTFHKLEYKKVLLTKATECKLKGLAET